MRPLGLRTPSGYPVAGKPVTDSVSLMTAIAAAAPGSAVEIRLRRGGREFVQQVQVGRRPPVRRQ